MKRPTIAILGALLATLATGCGKDEITQMTVKKVQPLLDEPPAEKESNPQGGPATSPGPVKQLSYDKPENWTDEGASGMRAASFTAGSAEARVQVSAIRLAGAAGGLLPNVNRWRGQLGLDPIVQDELELTTITLASGSAKLVEMESPASGDEVAQATLVAIVEQAGNSWFFKMTGPRDSVVAERTHFDDFMKSVRFAP